MAARAPPDHPNGINIIDDVDQLCNETPCGQYAVHLLNGTTDGFDESKTWYTSSALREGVVSRISGIRLITLSNDQGGVSSPNLGNWSWFELKVQREQNYFSWMSHPNAFISKSPRWREGRYFDRSHDLIKKLKGGYSIHVLFRRNFGWSINAERGYLVFNVGCEPFRAPINFEPSPYKRQVLVEGSSLLKTRLLLEDDRNYLDVVDTLETQEGIRVTDSTETEPAKLRTLGKCKLLIYSLLPNVDFSNLVNENLGVPGTQTLVLVQLESLLNPAEIKYLSWDCIMEDVWTKFLQPRFGQRPFHLIIRLGYEGAIYMGPDTSNSVNGHNSPLLVFEPEAVVGNFVDSIRKGNADITPDLEMAYTAGIVASLARETNESLEVLCGTQIKEAIISGLTWSRRFAALRFPQRGDGKEPTLQDMKYETASDPILLSLNTTISERAASGEPARVSLFDCLPYGNVYDKTPSTNLLLTSDDIVTNGPRNVLPYVPNASFGALRTADRTEIDGFRRIAHEIRGYVEKKQTGPLNLAVFGQPGSGKSFGIKQLIRTILKSREQTGAEFVFNLSQLENKEQLHSVFDTIRDQSFTKNIPVVFFDEFDSIFNGLALGWLNEFPAPFGTYPHKLGRGIHVYIGGTAPTFEKFKTNKNTTEYQEGQPRSPVSKGKQEIPKPMELERSSLSEDLKEVFPASLNNVVYLKVLLKELCSYGELVEQFHCIRNHVLDGKTPIVLFEDFDANLGDGVLGWVKYFLSPMQDAEFFVDGHARHIGRAVFVFIEGDSGRLAGFPDTTKFSEVVKRSKGPDFVSRLRGYIKQGENMEESLKAVRELVEKYLAGNRIGAKPLSIGVMKPPSSCSKQETEDSPPAVKEAVDVRQKFVDEIEKSTDGTSKDGYVDIIGPNKVDDADRMFYIRRAILLYSMAEMKNLEVEGELRQALLGVPTLRHGARSLEAILEMSDRGPDNVQAKTKVTDLPPNEQLSLHLDRGLLQNLPRLSEDHKQNREFEIAKLKREMGGRMPSDQAEFASKE